MGNAAASGKEDPSQPIVAGDALDLSQPIRITIIGAGRMGVAIGGELARRGAFVTFFDRTDFNRLRAMVALEAVLQATRTTSCPPVSSCLACVVITRLMSSSLPSGPRQGGSID